MPAFSGQPWRGAARVRKANGTNNGFRDWAVGVGIASATPTADQATWTGTPGSSLTLTYRTASSGTLPPDEANTVTVEIRTPNGSIIGSAWTPTADGQTRTFHFDDDPLNQAAGSARAGMVEIYIRAVRTSIGTYDVDSRGAGAGGNDQWAAGKLRAPVTLSSFGASDASLGGAEAATFEAFDTFFQRAVLDAVWYRSGALTLEHRQGGTLRRTAGSTTTAVTRDYTWSAAATGTTGSGRCNRDYTKGSAPVDVRLLLPSTSFGGDAEYVWAESVYVLTDSSGNGLTLTGTGSPATASRTDSTQRFGLGAEFDGVDDFLEHDSSLLSIHGDLSITLVCDLDVLGRWLFWRASPFGSDTKFGFSIDTNGFMSYHHDTDVGFNIGNSQQQIGVGRCRLTLTRNTATRKLTIKVNGTTLTFNSSNGFSADGTYTNNPKSTNSANPKFYIGRHPNVTHSMHDGAVYEMRIWDRVVDQAVLDQIVDPADNTYAGTPEGTEVACWFFETSAHSTFTRTADSTVADGDRIAADPTIPFTHLLQIGGSFGTPPLSKDRASAGRLPAELGKVAARATTASGGNIADGVLAWNEKLWDAGEDVGSEASPQHSRAAVSSTQGGQLGWSDALMAWDSQLPGGLWTYKQIITTADMTGLESNNTRTLALKVANPSYVVTVGVVGGPAGPSLRGLHFTPGLPLIVGLQAINSDDSRLLTVDPDGAFVMLMRYQDQGDNAGYSEFLDFDMVWKKFNTNGQGYFWPLTETVEGLSHVYARTFTAEQTKEWGRYGLFALGKAIIEGTAYAGGAKEVVAGPYNAHAIETA